MRLIDADALTEQIQNMCHYEYMANWLGVLIDTQPTVKVEPIEVPKPGRHGKWIIRDNPGTGWYRITCSECGEDVTSTAPCIGFFPNASVTWNYCPHCGAKMDGEHETD